MSRTYLRLGKGHIHTYRWKVVAELSKTLRFLASRGEEFNPWPVLRLYHSGLLCNKVLLKYKRDRGSFWHRHQKGGRKSAPLLVLSWMLYSYSVQFSHSVVSNSLWSHGLQHASTLLVRERKYLRTQRLTADPSPTTCILR